MRIAALATLLALLLACGGSKKQEAPALDGGLTGPSPGGTVEGATFAAADGGSLVVAPTVCNGVSVAGLVIAFSSYPGFCSFKRGVAACGDHPGTSELIVLMARASLLGAAQPFGPGTYTIATGATGGVTVELRRLNAACGDATTYQGVTGTVTIDQVTPTVKGSLTATFWSGAGGTGTELGALSGSFDAAPCTLPLDLCGLAAGTACPTPACVP